MADIQQLIEADKALLLSLNGSDSLFWDGFMWTVTDTKTWIPAVLVLLYVVFKNNRVPQGIVITLCFVRYAGRSVCVGTLQALFCPFSSHSGP